ncbi:non-ribosomal peptide synthetase [Paraburkholderia fungorum]|uniref:non-ribosomal peptide synthetase n=1 Tax=Paraburkholderia fungorum TaxID=134537 RepID=UPI000481561D|nr:non-ribosomal peptide synthetase [Paraburkholderia fungorum]MBB5542034.1 amino acid adenylation domain-containing protein/non-ribosomal peptide synthase protein (TIGR01720 family) [Paraburkholderia fungorum]PNE54150.1 non-ribosomal peptide synthetase [Paraburkholderia fungorum]
MTSFPIALHHRIRALARVEPDAPALASFMPHTVRLTRGELDSRAARLAAQLREAGVTTEVRVGVCVARSCDLFVALLAVLKAGGVFVALDPRHPAARLDWVAQDAGLAHGIVDASADAVMRARFAQCFDMANDALADAAAPRFEGDDEPVHPRAAAYMIYTSGSTGTPKAVAVEHGPLAAHGDALAESLPIGATDRVLHFASVNFDVSIEAWLVPLAVGGSVVISDPPPFPPEATHAFMLREGVTNTTLPPAYLREFANVCERLGVPPSLRVLLFGGEAMSQDSFDEIRRVFPSIRLVNGYGPTEAVISPMLWPVDPDTTPMLEAGNGYASLPIGWPIGRRAARIDGAVRRGEAGELLLGGVCLARGYHGRAALTAERFLPDASGEPGERIYRTGDLARERADGSFDYLGRIDDQVQVRGVRVEPGEIAACLLTHPVVADAGVIADATAGRTQLIACVVLKGALDDAALQAHLGAHVPQAWLPHRFARFERLPYTLNGKLDRAALRDAVAALPVAAAADYAAPATVTEQRLADIWQTLLNDPTPIGRTDRFFARGGDSLAAMQLQAAIRIEWGVNLRLDTLFDDQPLETLAVLIDTGETESTVSRHQQITVLQPSAAAFTDRAASFAQQRFWVLAQTRDAGSAYHVAVQWDVRGALDLTTLQRALDSLIARQEAWRTTLVETDDGMVMQRIHAALPVRIAEIDLHACDEAERVLRLAELTEQHVGASFDLSNGPLVRATLITLSHNAQRFLLTTHHAISDGWSSRCAFDELQAAYSAFVAGRTPQLPVLPVQYADYAQWQRDWLAAGEGERQLAYWRNALRSAPEPLALPLDRPRAPQRDYRGGRLALRLPQTVSAAVREAARRAQASPFTVLLAAFDAWLYRLTGATDIVVAAPIAHRQRAEVAPLVGLFLNTLALRARVAPDQSFAALLDGVRRVAFDAFAHQDVPFDQVLDAIKPPVRRGEEWLKVKFAQQFDLELTAELPGASVRMSPGLDLAARFDLALDFTDDPRGIELVIAYALDGIDDATAQAWLNSYAALVADAVRDPQCVIAELDCADGPEYDAARQGRALQPEADSVLALFARHASETPHRIALADADTQLTFAELDDASGRIALTLQQRNIGAEQPVAICIERSVRFVVALLGVMKSGACAVPLDPAAPHERLAAAVDACGAQWMLSAGGAVAASASGNATTLDIDSLAQTDVAVSANANTSTHAIRPAPLPDQAAYLIFTSGSTGTPKGVVISHRALADYVAGMLDELAFATDASMAMVSTVGADLGHTTLFGALCSGRTLHLLPAQCAFDPDRFAHEMRARKVGVLKIVPSHLHALLDAQQAADVLPAHALVTGGETLPWSLVERIAALKPACRVINHYGPTEATVGALIFDTSAPSHAALRFPEARPAQVHTATQPVRIAQIMQSVPLGLPLPNAYACVLDSHGAGVPPGGIGELYLGGPGLARGYLNRAAATAERFVPHPCAPGERLYRTGDRVKLRADRRLAFLGRLDDQVKIRGYRVEPGEVSAALRALEGVAQAETLAVEHEGRLRLASFVAPSDGARLDEPALRAALAARLPDYMVPAVMLIVAALPVTANGKVDRAALRALAAAPAPAVAEGGAPQGATEEALAAVWKEVLKAERVGRDDNFFELGGDSILVLQVIARSRKRGVRFTPKQLFDAPTLAQLACVATTVDVAAPATHAMASTVKAQAVSSQTEQATTLTPAQLRFFALDIAQRGHWNQSIELDAEAPFDSDAFARAFETLLTHHEIFRHRFAPSGPSGEWQLTFAPRAFETLPLAVACAGDENDALARFDALQSTLDLTHGPLVCALAALLPDGTTRLYLAIHHLIVDGVSWRALLDDLDAAYRAARERRTVRLASTGTRAQDWAARLARAALDVTNSPFAAEVPYWAALTAPYDDLPLDHPQARATNADAQTVVQTIGADLTRAALTEANAAYRTQMLELLIAALAQSLGLPRCRIELEGHGREALFDDVDVSRTPGWLTSHYPLQFTVESTSAATLCVVKDALRAVPNKGLGFGVLRHYGDATVRAALAAVPRPRVTFNYLGQFDASREAALVPRFGGVGCERDPAGPIGNALAIHAYVDGDTARTLKIHWVYGATQFERATIEALAERFETALGELTTACAARLAQRGGGATPGDYPLARAGGLTQAALERLPLDLRTVDDIYPLSPMQHGILFHSLFAPEQSTYVNQLIATLIEPDVERLRAAFEGAVPRHDILRTGFTPDEAAPMQIVHRQARMPVEILDWRDRGAAALDAFETWLAEDRTRGFDLTSPPLMRVALIRVTDQAWRLVWTRHHLLLDGWSTARFFADVLRDYIEPRRPQPFAAPAKTRYRDFIAWLAARDTEGERAFWMERLALIDEPTLIADRESNHNGEPENPHAPQHLTRRESFDADTTARLTETARRLKVTVNTVVQGAWALALQRMTHHRAVSFGATVAGRPDALPDAGTVLGLFINTLPVITAPLPQRSASTWLQELQRDNAAAAEHAHTPLYEIQQWAGQGGGALFDTLVVFENYPVDEAWQGRDERALKLRELRNIEATDFALTLVIEAGATLTIDYGYDAAQLDAARVATLHRAFANCLSALIADPHALLGTISIATADDLATQASANATTRSWPQARQQPLHRQFAQTAVAHPDAIALEFTDPQGRVQQMTYGALDANANRVAAALIEAGVRPDTAVALCVERSFDMVIALLGVLKAGAAYLPVDPDYPAERIAYLLNDAKPAVVLTQPHLRDRVTAAVEHVDVKTLTVDELLGSEVALAAAMEVAPEQLAYLIYTSGSTGKPKGAGNTHRALANRIAWMQDAYRLDANDVVLHKTPFGFDVSVWEFVWPLTVGAKLAIAAPGDHRDPARLVAAIETHRVTTLHFVPSMLAAFVAHLEDFKAAARCASIERIVASGEALAPELVARVAQHLPNARLYNLYGPTEAAIDVSHWTCDARDASAVSVPIGHPIANLQLHVLDEALQPLPPGAVGELYLGGVGLARGYLGRTALTAERFIPDPFVQGARLYRTGDLARRRADGALDYLGRIDTQVKLRGQRIEPGEIEALLRAQQGVHDAVVVVRDEQLIGYVARGADHMIDTEALLETLRAQLPAYMVPAQLIDLAVLPVTPNGKCDRHALPPPVRRQSSGEEAATSLQTGTERELAAIWARVLRLESVGRDDDFFALGGHSLLATQANAQANLHWTLVLPLRTLFDERTLQRCAAAIDRALAERDASTGGDTASAIDALLGELELQ